MKSGKKYDVKRQYQPKAGSSSIHLNYGDPIKHLNSLLEQDPNNNIAVLLKAWMLVLSNDGHHWRKQRKLVAGLTMTS